MDKYHLHGLAGARFAATGVAAVFGVIAVLSLSPVARAFVASARVGKAPSKRAAPEKAPLALWLDEENRFAFSRVLAAFGPDGENAPGAASGCMVASPSRPGPGGRLSEDENASYFYQWTRDGSLCLRVVVDRMIRAEAGEIVGKEAETARAIERRIRDFVDMNAMLQKLDNKSGTPTTGGLGEPKFMIDGSPFNDPWGRPQNDGPAIRASTLIRYANHLLDNRPSDAPYIHSHLWSSTSPRIINLDLEHVARSWSVPTFDLWEEVEADGGGHFYTSMVCRRAMRDGAAFARRPEVRDEEAAQRYDAIAEAIDACLEQFWNPAGRLGLEGGPPGGQGPKPDGTMGSSGCDVLASFPSEIPEELLKRPHIVPTLRRSRGQPKPIQCDTAVLLAICHASAAGGAGDEWAPWGERSLSTLDRLCEIFQRIYKINHDRMVKEGVAVGRYPEDSYDGVATSVAHAWFLCNHAVAETLYLATAHFASVSAFTVTDSSLPFFQRLSTASKVGTVKRGSKVFEDCLRKMRGWADGMMRVGQEYANATGEMSEQFHRDTGAMRGARELTWSYASFCTATDARLGRATM